MIDTIVLLIPPQHFKITKSANFNPDASLVYHGAVNKAVQNQPKYEKINYVYQPRVTLSRRMNLHGKMQIMLIIEVSLPKLLFGNNLEELRYKDFGTIVAKLHTLLVAMGIQIELEHLKYADIITVHYSKNIVFIDGTTPFYYIQKIQEGSILSRLDTNRTDYRNDGHCFKWHCNSYEIVFYDKLYDLMRYKKDGKKRVVDSYNCIDLKFIEKLRTKKKRFEILRMEVRLNKRAVMKKLFALLGIKNNLTFQKIFKPSISGKVLLHYLSKIEQNRSTLIDFKSKNDHALLVTLIIQNPILKIKDIVSYVGFKKLLETMTVGEIKQLCTQHQQASWHRFMREIDAIQLPHTQKPFEMIRQQLEHYKPVLLSKKRNL